jgi:hypothetical protein
MRVLLQKYLNQKSESVTLAVFRICFGIMMLYGLLRFWYKGWIETTYIDSKFHFKYYGFSWVKSLGDYNYVLFVICIISTILITIGYKYRAAMIVFFLSFTYIELIEKTIYLNHYYFVSILSFLMVFLPANATFSLDNVHSKSNYTNIPKWTIDSLKLLLCIVYFYAGLAKLNSDWLFSALPLKIWLPSKYDIPVIGETVLQYNWVHYAMSWGGMLYDLSIPFLLFFRKTRLIGFLLVVFFHLFTAVLFPIGMFPYIMIVSALVFFDPSTHHKIIAKIKQLIPQIQSKKHLNPMLTIDLFPYKKKKLTLILITVFFTVQLLLPFRYLLYPSELFWSEEGYRFSWRVMLVEKIGNTSFKIQNKKTGSFFYVNNSEFLSPLQEKQMSFQADMILEYAHYLEKYFQQQGHKDIAIFAESYVSLNGRPSQMFIDPKINLLDQKESFKPKTWIIPFNDDIKGL